MCGNDIRQNLLQDVVRLVTAQQISVIHGLHRGHAAHAGALGVGHLTRVHPAHQLRRGEARRQERIHRRNHVPQRHPVDRADHVGGDAPHRGIETGRDLRTHGPRQLGLARHPHLGAGLAGHLPVAAIGQRLNHRVLGIPLDELPSLGLGRHRESEVLVQEHRNQQRRRVIGVNGAVVHELADTDVGDHPVVVSLDQLRLRHQLTGFGVVPAGLGIVLPLDQPGGPGELQHAGRR
ncbi:Uncharacterised protein [Mycobacteroides abscessus subsp. abscessus]|nr:Uncharacterised protein [Mycobacteroides abscessus subsp. abscessus]